MDSGHSKMSCASSGTGMLLNKPYLGTVLKQIDLVSCSFPLYGSLASCLRPRSDDAVRNNNNNNYYFYFYNVYIINCSKHFTISQKYSKIKISYSNRNKYNANNNNNVKNNK